MLAQFKSDADTILPSRMTGNASESASKVYSRDWFGQD
jgi:hypothetical protein